MPANPVLYHSFSLPSILTFIRVASVAVARVAGVALMALGFCVAGVALGGIDVARSYYDIMQSVT